MCGIYKTFENMAQSKKLLRNREQQILDRNISINLSVITYVIFCHYNDTYTHIIVRSAFVYMTTLQIFPIFSFSFSFGCSH